MIVEEVWTEPDAVISTDACISGGGGVNGSEFFHAEFPDSVVKQGLHINELEVLALIVAIKLWVASLRAKRVKILCDNEASLLL